VKRALLLSLALLAIPSAASAQAEPETAAEAVAAAPADNQDAGSPGIRLDISTGDGEQDLVPALKIAMLLMVLTLLPALLMSVTSFTRIVVVLGFLRSGLGVQGLPPNQVLVGLALFLCLFTMEPVFGAIYDDAWVPHQEGELTSLEAASTALESFRTFMAHHTRPEDLALFVSMTSGTRPGNFSEVSTFVLVPAFMMSELRTAFMMGAMILVPFVVIDLVVSSVLMAMGMMMVPPVMVSMPIKVLLFVLADGWNLVIGSLARSVMGA